MYYLQCKLVIPKYVAEVKFHLKFKMQESITASCIAYKITQIMFPGINLLKILQMKKRNILLYCLNYGLAALRAAITYYNQWNLFVISLLETICIKKISILLMKLKTVCEHLPSTLLIWITKRSIKIKRNFKS